MKHADELRAAILADLDADEPRVVYADALQAAGDPLGELIAVQCELARLGYDRTRVGRWGTPSTISLSNRRRDWLGDGLADASDPKRVATLRAREKRLLVAHELEWTGDLEEGRYRFGRGFVDHVFGNNADPDMLLANAPFARSLELVLWEMPNAMTAPSLDRLRQLRVDCPRDNRTVIDRLGSLENLRELGISGLYPDALDAFEASPAIARLEALDLYESALDKPERLERLLTAARLRDLRLGMNGWGGAGRIADVFERCARVASLEILDFSISSLDMVPGALARLARSPHLQGLRALRVWEPLRPTCFADGARAIGESFPVLRILDLSANPFTGYLRDLLAGRGLGQLTRLGLRDCGLDDGNAGTLADSRLFGRLRVLDVRDNQLSHNGAFALANAMQPTVELLDLRGNRINRTAAKALKKHFPKTRVLVGRKS